MIDNNTNSLESETGIRLNKYLSDAGFCSRREADRYIENGKITVDGVIAVMGQRVYNNQIIMCDGQLIKKEDDKVLIAFNKPRGIECTANLKVQNNIISYINYPVRIYPIGRLDKDSHGLILLTNDGEIVNKILRSRNHHEKEYEVIVDKPITDDFIYKMEKGVAILDTVTRPCRIKRISKCKFNIIITQGLNRQIRRMCEALGYRVRDLKRIRIMNIVLGDIKTGEYRNVTKEEYIKLSDLTKDSYS